MVMSQHEKAILLAGGALGVDEDSEQLEQAREAAIAQLTEEWQRLKKDAFEEAEVADLLGISREKVGQLGNTQPPSLFMIPCESGESLFPKWQFQDDGVIPHLGDLLQAFRSEVHPLTVCRFMTMVNRDLEIDDVGV